MSTPNLRIHVLVASADPYPSQAAEGAAWIDGQRAAERDGYHCTGPIEYIGPADRVPIGAGYHLPAGVHGHIYALETDRRAVVVA